VPGTARFFRNGMRKWLTRGADDRSDYSGEDAVTLKTAGVTTLGVRKQKKDIKVETPDAHIFSAPTNPNEYQGSCHSFHQHQIFSGSRTTTVITG